MAENLSHINSAQTLLQDESNIYKTKSQSQIDDFDMVKKLGDGAYSSVYQAKRKLDGQTYAIKKVKLNNLSEKEKENAINEVRILASIKHPNVIQYKEAFFERNTSSLCIVMEYADNGDLFQQIVDHQKNATFFDEKDIWKIIIQVVRGLKSMHDLNIMHRDLKSANVFLCKDLTAKLGDMNVSKVANKKGLNYTQTGTPYYASPEVWRDEPYDVKSDIWSLGCVLYEMIALRPPFTSDDMSGLFKKVTKGYFPRIPKIYSHDLWTLVKQLIQVNPAYRPTCSQIMNQPTFAKKASLIFPEQNKNEQNILLKTIKFPKNMMYISDQLPRQNYQSPSDDLNNSYSTTNNNKSLNKSYKVQSKKDISLPSIQNVKQIYMNAIHLNSSNQEIDTSNIYPYPFSQRKKNNKSVPKRINLKNSSILRDDSHMHTENGSQDITLKEEKEQYRSLGAQKQSVSLEQLIEEQQSKLSHRNHNDLKKQQTDSLNRKSELPSIISNEKDQIEALINQHIQKNKSPTLLKNKAQSKNHHISNSLDYSTSQLHQNQQEQDQAIRINQNNHIKIHQKNILPSPMRQQGSPERVQEILNRYNIKQFKSKQNGNRRNQNNYTYKNQTINPSLSPKERKSLNNSISKQQIEISIQDEPNQLPIIRNPRTNLNANSNLRLPRLDQQSAKRQQKFVIEAIEIYKSNNASPKRQQRSLNKSKNNASFDSRVLRLQQYQ